MGANNCCCSERTKTVPKPECPKTPIKLLSSSKKFSVRSLQIEFSPVPKLDLTRIREVHNLESLRAEFKMALKEVIQ